jgi:hypothetical protein
MSLLKVDFTKIEILPKFYGNWIFPYQIFSIEFPLPKLIFTISLHYVYLKLILLGLG